jgi:hypothetical protein
MKKIRCNIGIDLNVREEHYYAIIAIIGKKESYTLEEIYYALRQSELQKN